jgi:hypothetical protein
MKINSILSLVILAAATVASASEPTKQVYIHGFRSPSIGAEYRIANWGLHAGYYTTILESGGKSTEFFKAGTTFYYKALPGEKFERFESFVSVAYMRGVNRGYKDKDAGFLESGFLYRLGKGFEVRLGGGLLVAKGFQPKMNPTVGISYSIPLR